MRHGLPRCCSCQQRRRPWLAPLPHHPATHDVVCVHSHAHHADAHFHALPDALLLVAGDECWVGAGVKLKVFGQQLQQQSARARRHHTPALHRQPSACQPSTQVAADSWDAAADAPAAATGSLCATPEAAQRARRQPGAPHSRGWTRRLAWAPPPRRSPSAVQRPTVSVCAQPCLPRAAGVMHAVARPAPAPACPAACLPACPPPATSAAPPPPAMSSGVRRHPTLLTLITTQSRTSPLNGRMATQLNRTLNVARPLLSFLMTPCRQGGLPQGTADQARARASSRVCVKRQEPAR